MSENVLVQAKKSPVPAWLRAMRPKQWVKNILVFAAPVAAGALFDPRVLVNTLWAFLAFSLISASIWVQRAARAVATASTATTAAASNGTAGAGHPRPSIADSASQVNPAPVTPAISSTVAPVGSTDGRG